MQSSKIAPALSFAKSKFSINFMADALCVKHSMIFSGSANCWSTLYDIIFMKTNQSGQQRFLKLTHFQPMFHFYIPWKHQKTSDTMVENVLTLETQKQCT